MTSSVLIIPPILLPAPEPASSILSWLLAASKSCREPITVDVLPTIFPFLGMDREPFISIAPDLSPAESLCGWYFRSVELNTRRPKASSIKGPITGIQAAIMSVLPSTLFRCQLTLELNCKQCFGLTLSIRRARHYRLTRCQLCVCIDVNHIDLTSKVSASEGRQSSTFVYGNEARTRSVSGDVNGLAVSYMDPIPKAMLRTIFFFIFIWSFINTVAG